MFDATTPPPSCSVGAAAEKADLHIALKAGEARHHPVIRAVGAASEISDQIPSVAACSAVLAFGLLSGRAGVAEAGARMLGSVLVAAALKSVVKGLVSRTRPRAVIEGRPYTFDVASPDDPDQQSFPSGHTAGAVAAARGFARTYPGAGGPAYAAAAAIALIQVPRGKHYLGDLAGGAAVGIAAEAAVETAIALVRARSGTS